MNTSPKKEIGRKNKPVEVDFFKRVWQESWTYIKTVVDVVHEPILILNKEFRIIAANEPFYRTFLVESKDTEGKVVYELGNGQWDIPALRKLLGEILPRHSFFKGFEVTHDFPSIGRKVMVLNARRIYTESSESDSFPPTIILAMEDVTEMMAVAKKFADYTNWFEVKMAEQKERLEAHIKKMETEIEGLKKS